MGKWNNAPVYSPSFWEGRKNNFFLSSAHRFNSKGFPAPPDPERSRGRSAARPTASEGNNTFFLITRKPDAFFPNSVIFIKELTLRFFSGGFSKKSPICRIGLADLPYWEFWGKNCL